MRLFALKVPDTVPEDTLDRLIHHLPERAQDRVRKFRHESDAIRSVAGRLLPTWYLRASGLVPPPTQPTFSHGQRGKPYLATPEVPGLDFNTTHEGAYVLLAVVRSPDGEKAEVGVDVMDLPAEPDKLASEIDHVLTLNECLFLAGTRGRVKAKLLTTLWTIKEGFSKALGEGVPFGLDRIEVDPGDGGVAGIKIDGKDVRADGWRWVVGSIEGGEYGYAVIWRGEGGEGGVQSGVKVEEVRWEAFVRAFIGTGGEW